VNWSVLTRLRAGNVGSIGGVRGVFGLRGVAAIGARGEIGVSRRGRGGSIRSGRVGAGIGIGSHEAAGVFADEVFRVLVSEVAHLGLGEGGVEVEVEREREEKGEEEFVHGICLTLANKFFYKILIIEKGEKEKEKGKSGG